MTIIGAISPPAGDFSEPVTMNTRRCVRTFWALDRERAQARFYPAIHPLQSYSADVDALAHWWQTQGNPDWVVNRRSVLELLETQMRLERMARIVGKDALPAAAAAHSAVRGARQRCRAAPVVLLRGRPLLLAATADRHPGRGHALREPGARGCRSGRAARAHRGAADAADSAARGEEYGEERIADIRQLWQQLEHEFATLRRS